MLKEMLFSQAVTYILYLNQYFYTTIYNYFNCTNAHFSVHITFLQHVYCNNCTRLIVFIYEDALKSFGDAYYIGTFV